MHVCSAAQSALTRFYRGIGECGVGGIHMRKCDNCSKPATVHLTEIKGGQKIEKHLCEQCAVKNEGVNIQSHQPINELLTNFVMAHSGLQKELGTACEHCGITWAEFRQSGLLGCEHDYTQFEKELTPLLARAHENASHHSGKAPTRGGGGANLPRKRKAVDIGKLRKELQRALELEDYERAASLRDAIRQAEAPANGTTTP
jgi:protein arginine kinase activator